MCLYLVYWNKDPNKVHILVYGILKSCIDRSLFPSPTPLSYLFVEENLPWSIFHILSWVDSILLVVYNMFLYPLIFLENW